MKFNFGVICGIVIIMGGGTIAILKSQSNQNDKKPNLLQDINELASERIECQNQLNSCLKQSVKDNEQNGKDLQRLSKCLTEQINKLK